MSETSLTKAIAEAINSIPGCYVWKNNVGRRGNKAFGKKGSADITGIMHGGRRVEFEVKLPKNNHFEPGQLAFIERMKLLGACAGVVRSVDDAVLSIKVAIAQHRGLQRKLSP